jgi:hypothetical protein
MVSGRVWPLLIIAKINENGPAPGAAASLNVSPPISNHETGVQIDAIQLGSFLQKTGVRLPPRTVIVVLITDENLGDRHRSYQVFAHRLDNLSGLSTSNNIGLVCRPDDKKACVVEPLHCLGHAG